jgi:hypothetical protein
MNGTIVRFTVVTLTGTFDWRGAADFEHAARTRLPASAYAARKVAKCTAECLEVLTFTDELD